MKKLLALLFVAVLALAGCVQKKSDVEGGGNADTSTGEKPTIEILGTAAGENDLNILRDQLTKNGFEVVLNIQPDYGSFSAQKDAGNYDVALSSWTTVTGNPDYAVRGLFKTGGDYSVVSDSNLDALIDKASTLTGDEAKDAYAELEQLLVFDQAYIAPLYISKKAQGIYSAEVNPETVLLPKSRAQVWEAISFNDESLNASETLVLHQAIASLTSLDPIKGNDGSINTLNTNMYVRLVNLTDDDQVVSDGSLSYNHVIAEGNSEYYFILRDDINFAKVENGAAVDTGELVSAEDVVFSLNRAKDESSVPDHRTYSIHENIDTVEVVTDLAELENAKVAGTEETVLDALSKELPQAVTEVVESEDQVDNAAGKYQVVKITTPNPFPQVLNYLAHQSGGIVSEKQVTSINTFDVASYDPNTDVAYGDQATVTEGSSYNNHLYASGPYILVQKNDYEATFVKNPAYRIGTEYEPKITNISVRFIDDNDSALSALRNGEIHVLQTVPETKLDIVKSDTNLALNEAESNAVTYLQFNTKGREVSNSADLRKAVLYSINQEEFITYYQGYKRPAVSTVTPLVDTGLKLEANRDKVTEFLNAYNEGK
ncbi:ABC transporter substrate-binding protein [Ureibacillus chungkukjangi]|uniref:Peptide/nickel transport system substrate-binding protein n=1 Tax=Ureibacillus chungkukjangi TaxID=1202712 RepID=A0A318TWF1_9BACL|nr:ABC transporter substrate-binding protein [Ureibacillus chungkukjangi]MCM3390113.1 ABC transporter substrate-binding protein [Ureibacillus chungkukjangi]PYF06305.1 peptide/nickel transport system substrate-binding protein [Ureibacillus chungkukjangi]